MTKQFHAGQDVEVDENRGIAPQNQLWRKAKIVCPIDPCEVKFPDGTRGVFNEAHIRADTTLRVSSNDPMGTRPMTKDETRDFRAALAEAHDEAIQAEGKP